MKQQQNHALHFLTAAVNTILSIFMVMSCAGTLPVHAEESSTCPSQSFKAEAVNGISVTADAPEGCFPANTTMKVVSADRDAAI